MRTVPKAVPTVTPSPPPPPFGYCGGLHTTADARWITVGGEAVALIRATVRGPATPVPHVDAVKTNPLANVAVLAGRLANGIPSQVESSGLRPGDYLLLIGGNAADYFVSFGLYGSFRVSGRHAYRLCYDFGGGGIQLVRVGITDVPGLTRLFAAALR